MLKGILIGRVGKDAEERATQTGTQLCSFSLACDYQAGREKKTQWVNCTLWGNRAAKLAQYLTKGKQVFVDGQLSLREHNGKSYLECNIDDLQFISSPDSTPQQKPAQQQGQTQMLGLPSDPYKDDIPNF